jgi:hypothetical protein
MTGGPITLGEVLALDLALSEVIDHEEQVVLGVFAADDWRRVDPAALAFDVRCSEAHLTWCRDEIAAGRPGDPTVADSPASRLPRTVARLRTSSWQLELVASDGLRRQVLDALDPRVRADVRAELVRLRHDDHTG